MSAARRAVNAARASRKLIVLGLRWTTCQNILKDHFSKFGIVDNARVIFDLETGRSKGFGFVVMRDLKGAKKAMAAAPHVIEGRTVHVDHRQSQTTTTNFKNLDISGYQSVVTNTAQNDNEPTDVSSSSESSDSDSDE